MPILIEDRQRYAALVVGMYLSGRTDIPAIYRDHTHPTLYEADLLRAPLRGAGL